MNTKTIILLLTLVSFNVSAFVTVGTDASCDYDNLLDAYNDADAFVRVTNQVAFTDEFTIGKTQWFTGGYDNCPDAEQGIFGTNKSKWRRVTPGSVVSISGQQQAQALVLFSGFEFFGGNTQLVRGGGIDVTGNVSVLIGQSEIYDNESATGGGIFIQGEDAIITMTDVIIRDNLSTGPAGGIYCSFGSQVTMLGQSAIRNNEAANFGGGIYANEGCEITFKSGDNLPALQTQTGIFGNSALQGGGVFLASGAQMDLHGTAEHPASIIFNTSTHDSVIEEGGGGFFITDPNTRLDAENARIDLNIAKNYGAGGVVLEQAVFTMKRAEGSCWSTDHCSSLSYNILTGEVGIGGALDVYGGGIVQLSQTLIQFNRANRAAVLDASQTSYVRMEGNVIAENSHWTNDSETTLFAMSGTSGNGGNLDFFYNSLANNMANSVFDLSSTAQHHLSVHNAIIQHPLIQDDNGNSNNIVEYDCAFLSENNSITGNVGIINGNDPLFVDAANGNFKLQSNSPAIDYCDEQTFIGAAYQDITGLDRGLDDPANGNFLGSFDAGAYEHNGDVIFVDDFE
ncbi:MAG: hypothetical protein R3E90_00795 [Marinicella sp.]